HAESESLSQLIAREAPMAQGRVAFIAAQVLAALSAAHRRGIAHGGLDAGAVLLYAVAGVGDLVRVVGFGAWGGDPRWDASAVGAVTAGGLALCARHPRTPPAEALPARVVPAVAAPSLPPATPVVAAGNGARSPVPPRARAGPRVVVAGCETNGLYDRDFVRE